MNFGIFSFSWVPDVFCSFQSPRWIAGSYFSYSTYCNSRYNDQKKKALQYLHLVHFKNTKVSRRERNQFQANDNGALNRFLPLCWYPGCFPKISAQETHLACMFVFSKTVSGEYAPFFHKLCVHMRVYVCVIKSWWVKLGNNFTCVLSKS